MLVADSSALAAIVFGEPDAELLAALLQRHAGEVLVSAVTRVEATIVVEARQGTEAVDDLDRLLERVGASDAAVDGEVARVAIAAWRRFGKGRHAAALNFGDCFAYATAKQNGCALLFKGEDFSRTDVADARTVV